MKGKASDGKECACSAEDPGSTPGSGRSPGEGNGNPLQYSCHGQRSLVGYSPWGHKEVDTTEQLILSLSEILSFLRIVFRSDLSPVPVVCTNDRLALFSNEHMDDVECMHSGQIISMIFSKLEIP